MGLRYKWGSSTEDGYVLDERACAFGDVGPVAVLAQPIEHYLHPARLDHPVLVGVCALLTRQSIQ